jgi:RNA polymerase sigma factor (sigma-70 family)
MARSLNVEVRRHVRALFDVGTVAGLSDGQLLERCAGRGGEAAELAFTALVERHGPMVLRVCRRVLVDPHDAEDAFQAVFLVLVRRARSIRSRDSVASWLHGVALRVSSAARSARERRTGHERRAAESTTVAANDRSAGDELGRALQEEISRLPERYQAAVVLCHLEGRTYDEAARLLGCPVGTVKSRLASAREKLRAGLTRRGLGPPSVVIGGVLAAERARAAVPCHLAEVAVSSAVWPITGRIEATVVVPAAVAALAEGVLQTMILTKLRMTAVLLLAVGIGVGSAGVGVLAQQSKETDDQRVGGAATARPLQAVPVPEVKLGSGDRPRQGIRFPKTFTGVTEDEARGSPADQRDGPKQTTTVARPYYIGDLILPRGTVRPQLEQRAQIDMTPLIELIASSVAPGTWKGYDKRGKPKQGNGGHDEQETGSITPFYLSVSLIIRHTDEVHAQIADRLRQLRRLLLLDTAPAALVSETSAENRPLNAKPALAPGSESAMESRLREVERKLDRVLKALESSRRDTGDAPQPF